MKALIRVLVFFLLFASVWLACGEVIGEKNRTLSSSFFKPKQVPSSHFASSSSPQDEARKVIEAIRSLSSKPHQITTKLHSSQSSSSSSSSSFSFNPNSTVSNHQFKTTGDDNDNDGTSGGDGSGSSPTATPDDALPPTTADPATTPVNSNNNNDNTNIVGSGPAADGVKIIIARYKDDNTQMENDDNNNNGNMQQLVPFALVFCVDLEMSHVLSLSSAL
jgi:hypothetical protein